MFEKLRIVVGLGCVASIFLCESSLPLLALGQSRVSDAVGLVVMSGPKYDGHYTMPIDEHRDYGAVVATLQRLADVYGHGVENTFMVSRVYRVWGSDLCTVYWREAGALLELKLPVNADQWISSRTFQARIPIIGNSPSEGESLADNNGTESDAVVKALLLECERYGKKIVFSRSLIPPGRSN